jgi:hypothetical protein
MIGTDLQGPQMRYLGRRNSVAMLVRRKVEKGGQYREGR